MNSIYDLLCTVKTDRSDCLLATTAYVSSINSSSQSTTSLSKISKALLQNNINVARMFEIYETTLIWFISSL